MWVESSSPSIEPEGGQPNHADGYVGAVEASQGVEARTEEVGRKAQPPMHEVSELVHLHPDEEHTARERRPKPAKKRLSVPPLSSTEGEHHEKRAEQEECVTQRDKRNLENRLKVLTCR